MEIFTGDRSIPNPEDFPRRIAPFPEATDLLYPHPTAVIRSPEAELIAHHPTLPAQKLRPIRCNGRSPAGEAPYDVASPDVGFLGGEMCGFNGEFKGCFESPAKGRDGAVTENGGGGNGCLLVDGREQVGSGMGTGTESWNPNREGRLLEEEESSSSSEDGDDSSMDKKGPVNRKRKRKSWKKLELFLENLVMKVMERQEQMHKQLIEMIEKRERERINREEAWKQQEMERMKRDEQVRAQETSRSLALISFIQNVLGHEIEIPQPLATLPMEEDAGKVHIQKDELCDPNNRRWPEAEVQALITLRTSLEHKFRMMSPKGSVWEEISFRMHNMGYNRSAKKCKEKWENINKYFKRSMGSGKKRPENIKTCPYFQDLDILYRNGLVYSGTASNNTDQVNAAVKIADADSHTFQNIKLDFY